MAGAEVTMRFSGKRLFVAASLMLAAFASPAFAACNLTKIVELPVTMRGRRPTTQAKINGVDETLAVASGAFMSTLPPKIADALKLPRLHDLRPVGVGGVAYKSELTTVQTLNLADQVLHDVQFVIIPDTGEGSIGQNLLGRADTEYDFKGGAVRLFKAEDCAGSSMAYWANGKDYSVLPINWQNQRNPHTKADASVNGIPISVSFSTSSRTSALSLTAARRLGLDVNGPHARYIGMVRGIGPNAVKAWVVDVASFKIGDEEIRNTQLRVIDDAWPGLDTDMGIGADFFLSHRVMVANSQHQLYFTYNGGPVFELEEPAAAKAADDAGPPKAF
jgi:hypothetical protein